MLLECSNPVCGEIVSVAGNVGSYPEQARSRRNSTYTLKDGNVEWFDHFAPSFMDPPPPIIALPRHLPRASQERS